MDHARDSMPSEERQADDVRDPTRAAHDDALARRLGGGPDLSE